MGSKLFEEEREEEQGPNPSLIPERHCSGSLLRVSVCITVCSLCVSLIHRWDKCRDQFPCMCILHTTKSRFTFTSCLSPRLRSGILGFKRLMTTAIEEEVVGVSRPRGICFVTTRQQWFAVHREWVNLTIVSVWNMVL